MKKLLFSAAILASASLQAQNPAYENLRYLTKTIGARLSGSENAQKAVEWGKKVMEDSGFDTVYLQPVMVPHWERGKIESAFIHSKEGTRVLSVKTLGGSVGTADTLIRAGIVEVKSFTELEKLGREKIAGKVVLFNRPMDPKFKDTFKAYSGAVDQRGDGAWQAARYGAVAVMVRSMSLKQDLFAHTGSLHYKDSIPRIPAIAVSTTDADWISQNLTGDQDQKAVIKLSAKWYEDAPSYNVIGELKGSTKRNEIIVIGGHLDSWDVGEGAHDDGAGIVHSIEAVRLLKAEKYKPKHTIRCVLFMNEENGNRGGQRYAFVADSLKEKHVAAIESDRGGFAPESFSIDGDTALISKWQKFLPALKPYGISEIYAGYGGVDIGPLKKYNPSIPLVGFAPESTHYFDYHHADSDRLEAVDPKELEDGAKACSKMIRLLDNEMSR
ncbi:MAG: M20/M25/M40 family metallo-hydrolase [Bacteroidota bacterium]